MSTGELFGYIASALVFATFYMKTMVPLRTIAIASNVAFIIYAAIGGLAPILILHSALLPLNVLRLVQLRELSAHIAKASSGEFSAQAILPLMKKKRVPAKERLFTKDDPADELYYIAEGTLFLPEVQKEVCSGAFLGEFGLFSEAGQRTATAIAMTDCTIMVLTKKAVFAAMLQHPQLGIHLLKLITVRMLQNTGQDPKPISIVREVAPRSADEILSRGRLSVLLGPRGKRVAIAALGVAPIIGLIYQPVYMILERDAAATTWLNVATAPISGTIEGFDIKVGQPVEGRQDVATIVNHSADRSAVIRAAAAARQAEMKFAQLRDYGDRVAKLAAEWTERKSRYADAFRHDLDLEIQNREQQLALQKERAELADVQAQRRLALRVSGSASQADADVAVSSYRQLQLSVTEMAKALERVRERRRMAGLGVFIQQDGKEPEWSWRSLDEINLEMVRADRAVADAQEEVNTAIATRDQEERNFAVASTASITVPNGMRVWSITGTNGSAVKQGDPLFTWIDCTKLLVDVPVTETLATLLPPGMKARVALEGDAAWHNATVVLARSAASRLSGSELASISRSHNRGTAQVVVSLPDSIPDCPIGRRAFVSFPDIGLFEYTRAYLAALHLRR